MTKTATARSYRAALLARRYFRPPQRSSAWLVAPGSASSASAGTLNQPGIMAAPPLLGLTVDLSGGYRYVAEFDFRYSNRAGPGVNDLTCAEIGRYKGQKADLSTASQNRSIQCALSARQSVSCAGGSVMVAEVFAGLSALKTAFDMAKGLENIHETVARDRAIIELQKEILAAQAAQASLIENVGTLKSRVAELEQIPFDFTHSLHA